MKELAMGTRRTVLWKTPSVHPPHSNLRIQSMQQTKKLKRKLIENRSDQRDAKKDRSERTANIFRESSGNVLGAAIWLNAAELNKIGINVDDTECVEVCIENGDLQLVAAIGDENQ